MLIMLIIPSMTILPAVFHRTLLLKGGYRAFQTPSLFRSGERFLSEILPGNF